MVFTVCHRGAPGIALGPGDWSGVAVVRRARKVWLHHKVRFVAEIVWEAPERGVVVSFGFGDFRWDALDEGAEGEYGYWERSGEEHYRGLSYLYDLLLEQGHRRINGLVQALELLEELLGKRPCLPIYWEGKDDILEQTVEIQ